MSHVSKFKYYASCIIFKFTDKPRNILNTSKLSLGIFLITKLMKPLHKI